MGYCVTRPHGKETAVSLRSGAGISSSTKASTRYAMRLPEDGTFRLRVCD